MLDKKEKFKALIKNKKLGQAIRDGMDAPIGSTKRNKARAILASAGIQSDDKTFKQLGNQGGPGDTTSTPGVGEDIERFQQDEQENQEGTQQVGPTIEGAPDAQSKDPEQTEGDQNIAYQVTPAPKPNKVTPDKDSGFTTQGPKDYTIDKGKEVLDKIPFDTMDYAVRQAIKAGEIGLEQMGKFVIESSGPLGYGAANAEYMAEKYKEGMETAENAKEKAMKMYDAASPELKGKLHNSLANTAKWGAALAPLGAMVSLGTMGKQGYDAITEFQSQVEMSQNEMGDYAQQSADQADQAFQHDPMAGGQSIPPGGQSTPQSKPGQEIKQKEGLQSVPGQTDKPPTGEPSGDGSTGDDNMATIFESMGMPPETASELAKEMEMRNNEDFKKEYSSLDEDQQNIFDIVSQSVARKVGPQAFSYKVMNDKEALKTLLPNVPEEELPTGASAAKQVHKLYKRKREEKGLDEKFEELQQMQKTNMNIDQHIDDFLRSKDKYGNKLDDMIDETKQKMVSMPPDAKARGQMENYLNYLHTLKGKQDKRLDRFVTDTVKSYQNDVKLKQQEYKELKNQFNTEFSLEAKITKDKYKQLRTVLQSMYKSVQSQQTSQAQQQKTMLSNLSTKLDLMDQLDNLKQDKTLQSHMQNNEFDGLSDALNLPTKSISYQNAEGDQSVINMPVGNISGMIDAASSSMPGVSSDQVLGAIQSKMVTDGYKVSDMSYNKTLDFYNNYGGMIKEFNQNVQNSNKLSRREKVKRLQAAGMMADQFNNTVYDAVKNYMNKSPEFDINSIKDKIRQSFQKELDGWAWTQMGADEMSFDQFNAIMRDWQGSGDLVLKGLAEYAKKSVDPSNFERFVDIFIGKKGSIEALTKSDIQDKVIKGLQADFSTIATNKPQNGSK